MRILLLLLYFCAVSLGVRGQSNPVLDKLDGVLADKKKFLQIKYAKIDSLKIELQANLLKRGKQDLYKSYTDLYYEYRSFKYDSAYYYLDQANVINKALNQAYFTAESTLNEGFILLSSGLFKEALDLLEPMKSSKIPEDLKYRYYYLIARTYYDLAEFNDDQRFSIAYIQKGNDFLEKALLVSEPYSANFWAAKGLRDLKQQNWVEAKTAFIAWIQLLRDTDKAYGAAISSLSHVYEQLGETNTAIECIALAAISDTQQAVKENIALRNLANLLYKEGSLEKANAYVHLAMNDATFYNARHRKIQISSILPIIEGAQLFQAEQRNINLKRAVIVLVILVLAVIVFLIIIVRQAEHKNAARKALNQYNARLEDMNQNLREADAIKQDYITYFLKATSQLITKLGTLQRSTIHKIKTKHPEEVLHVLKKYSVKKERQDLFRQFDAVFLKLFPSFIAEFNALFSADEKKVLKKEDLLNTELRIFALYRLGIQDVQQVAQFLEISVATIYTYKTRLKSKSDFRDTFEDKIMAIKKM